MPGILGTVSGQIRMDVRQAVAAYAAVRAQNSKLTYALRGSADSFIRSGRAMTYAGLGLVAVFGKAVTSAAEFQRRMDFFGAVTNANKKEIRELSKFTLKLGTDSIYSANEIADGFIELGKAGISTKGILDGIGKAMVNLGQSADIPLADAGQIITSTIKTFQLGARDATKVVNELQGAANATIADVADIGVSLKYVGGIAATTGVSLNDTVTAISLLAQAGIRGSTAGTSLRQMLVSLPGATGPAVKELKALGLITKDNNNLFYDQKGNLKPLGTVFQILQQHMKGLNSEQRIMALRTIFNNRALAAASILTRDGAHGFKVMNAEIKKTTAAEVAHKRLNNLSGDLKKLKSNLDILFIRGGSPFQKQARQWVQSLTRLIKAFGNLSPKQQKMIVQTIGMTGAILLAMGIFNLIIGTILKFIGHMIQMGAAIKFVLRWVGIIITNLRWLVTLVGTELAEALGITVGALFFWVAVIIAVIGALVLLYKKWKPFHDLVDTVAKALLKAGKAVGKFVLAVVKGIPGAWKALSNGAKSAWTSIRDFFSNLAGNVKSWFSNASHAISNFVDDVGDFVKGVINWFKELPTRVVTLVSNFVGKVTKLLTFRNLGFAIGFVIGRMIRLWYDFWRSLILGTANMVRNVIHWFKTMGPKVLIAIHNMEVKAINAMLTLAVKIAKAARNAYNHVISWFQKLPGRVASFVYNMAQRAIKAFNKARVELPKLAGQVYNSVVNWLQKLPGRVGSFFARMAAQAVLKLHQLLSNAQKIANQIYNGLINGIQGLPAATGQILDKVIDAIRGVITKGFNAVRDFASGLWSGFKKGLGISSPSFIERAMWQITGVMDEETRKMARHTMRVQALSKQLAMTGWERGDYYGASGRQGIVGLASMHARNRDRMRSIAGVSRPHKVRVESGAGAKTAGERHARLTITNWHEGRGFMREVADDAVDDNQSFLVTVNGMDY